MTKEQFVSAIEELKDADDLQNQIDDIMKKSLANKRNDFMNAASLQISHEELVIDLLEEIFDDEGQWIVYWIYELDYGKKYTKGCVVDDKPIDISTAGKLYDFLIKNKGER